MTITVRKRNGNVEKFDAEKINRVAVWSCEGLTEVSPSDILMKAQIQMYDGVETDLIHDTLIKSAADLISVETPDYQYPAARLLLFKLRKMAYGGFEPRPLYEQILLTVAKGKYDEHLIHDYSKEEIDFLDSVIDHNRDLNYTYAAMRQYEDKYLVKDRVTGEIFESPQTALMLIAMGLMSKEKKSVRLDRVVALYDAVSTMKVSLPTPIMGGVRTPTRQFSSCVLIESGDDINQIFAAVEAQGKYAAQRAGIGLNFGAIRGQDAPIRGGEVKHAGTVGIVRMYQESLGWASQGGLRKASANYFYPMWHWDFENLIVMKNNRGTESTRARHVDYGVQINKFLYTRLQKGGKISFFHPNVANGDLYKFFFEDQDKFAELYEKLEKDPSVPRKELDATDAFLRLAQERSQTGRIYVQNVDHCNTNSPFDSSVAPIKQSNLCVAPETKILTDKGYVNISSVAGQKVKVWNGEEFSEVDVVKTGTDQKLIKVTTDSGYELECTEYHKFYVQRGDSTETDSNKLNIEEIRAKDLQKGDKLIKFDLPVIQGDKELNVELLDGLRGEFFVPDVSFNVKGRIDWLTSLADNDGAVVEGSEGVSVNISNTDHDFLKEVQLMLQTLGVTAKINVSVQEGGEVYNLNIGGADIQSLFGLGLKFNRLDVKESAPNRDAGWFVKVESVVDDGRIDDTYCFTEHKRHMGMFNGMLTGQCMEIALPTSPINNIKDPNDSGEVALCTLSAINLGKIDKLEDLEEPVMITVRALDNLLDYQNYPVLAAEKTKLRRTLGVGWTNLAYYLAKRGLKYSSKEAANAVHELAEAFQYYLLKASVQLAKERGACEWFDQTSYSRGVLPIDRYKKEVDQLHTAQLKQDWEALRLEIALHGLRNSTLSTMMPCETSSQITNSTNGIEPPRGPISFKKSPAGMLPTLVPGVGEEGVVYEYKWDMDGPTAYLNLMAIIQKFIDQSISTNTFYKPWDYPGGKLPIKVVLRDLMYAYKFGIKTVYYQETRDGEDEEDEGCESGACKL